MGTSDFVALSSRFTSGWPWPEDSWGLEAMYGINGWCDRCGVPMGRQTGGLVLQGAKFPTSDFWMPNWHFDALCVRISAASQLLESFRIDTLPVRTPRKSDVGVAQLVPTVATRPWFDEHALAEAVAARHGDTGVRCAGCDTWRWLPVLSSDMPPATLGIEQGESDLIASSEWFGSGMSARHELRFRRPLAEALTALNPRVWSIVET